MKLQNVPLADIVWNPWRDKTLFPIDADHLASLRASIDEFGFWSSVKGRRRNGKVELGCGHTRFEAAKRAKLETIPIYIEDMDDDTMLRLMTVENATQFGGNSGAVMNEVAAVTRRLIEGLLIPSGTIVPDAITMAFANKDYAERARIKLRKGTDVHLALGHNTIRSYLGNGNPDKSDRGEREVREAISALKQSGRYDDMVDEMVQKYPPVFDGPPSEGKKIISIKTRVKRRILDERCANLFPNDHQFHAFREAVTTPAAQRVISVDQQYALAKDIMKAPIKTGAEFSGATTKKQIGAPYIKKMVQYAVQEGMKKQREIDKEEKERFLAEQREERIDSELHSANASLRSLLSALARLQDLAKEFPAHPKIGGFAVRLDTLAGAIREFSKRIK